MNKQQIEQCIEALRTGEAIEVERNGQFAVIGGAGKDYKGSFRTNGWYDKIEEARERKGKEWGYTDLSSALQDHTYLDSYAFSIGEPVKPGTKIYIKDNLKEECRKWGYGWWKSMRDLVGKIFEVQIRPNNLYLVEHSIQSFYIPRTAFTLVLPEEETITLQVSLSDYKKLKDVKGVTLKEVT